MKLKERRRLIYKLLEKEIEENELNIMPYCFGSISYYNSKYFKNSVKKDIKKNKSSQILSIILKPFFMKGVYDFEDREIMVFYDSIPFYSNIISLLQTVFHELFHALDGENKTTGLDQYTTFSNECDKFLFSNISMDDYINYVSDSKSHDSYMFEILANIYGIEKSKKYISENNIKCSRYELHKINKLEKKYLKQYKNYDLTKSLNSIINNYKKYIVQDDFDSTIFECFLTNDGKVKDINMIFSNDNLLKLDPRILSSFVKTEKIKEAIKNSKLEDNTFIVLEKILNSKISLSNTENIKNSIIK